VHHDAHIRIAALGLRALESLAKGFERGCALLVVGRIHVDVEGFRAGRLDARLDLFDMGERSAEVEVDAADAIAGLGQRQRCRLTHPGRGTEDQRPALAVIGHGRGV
jgi:hypothetical protein